MSIERRIEKKNGDAYEKGRRDLSVKMDQTRSDTITHQKKKRNTGELDGTEVIVS